MDFAPTSIPGCFRVIPPLLADPRGAFVKLFTGAEFSAQGLETSFCEQFYTVSRAGVLRGLHFQAPPSDHAKLVTCLEGEVLDAVLDLRTGSPTFGRHEVFPLSPATPFSLYLPRGLAHGFLVTGERAVMLYNVTSQYDPARDRGIRWDSAGIPWPTRDPILSARDRSFPPLSGFASPFCFGGTL